MIATRYVEVSAGSLAGTVQEALLAALAERERELAGALERRTATADILKVIASSPSDTGHVRDYRSDHQQIDRRALDGCISLYRGLAHLVAFTPTSPTADAALKAAFPISLADLPILALVRDGEVAQFANTDGRTCRRSTGIRRVCAAIAPCCSRR